MPDLSVILAEPTIRALVQENLLERAFHDSLFPRQLFRAEAEPVVWPENVGDSMVFTGVGLIKPKLKPLAPGVDPLPSTYGAEQWTATIQPYMDTIDTHMPTSVVAIANLFLRNAQQLGLSAGQSLNRLVRNRLYAAALSGHTVVDGTPGAPVTTFRVKRLNGFTKARRPDLPTGSAVRFDPVSTSNPLKVDINGVAREVIAFTPDVVGDEVGPGTITIQGGTVTVTDRDYVFALDKTYLVRVGGGNSIDAISTSDNLKLANIRAMVARMRQMNVPEMPDGRYHCHFDPTSEAQIYDDDEWQRLLTALPDHFMYRQFAIGEILGTVYFRNTECPLPETVDPFDGVTYSQDDPFAGELKNNASVVVHRPLFVGQGAVFEYYLRLDSLITEAGVTGRVGDPRITNNGIEINTDRVQILIRSPLNRAQDLVASTWKFLGDWPVRTDITTGDGARYKRVGVIEHG